ncbi:alpha-ribazole-5'-phosphate phosphatase [Desulfocucumis palustris]|uniref:Alpha-ribazole phosphatase n=1 Tax=Desulfocucumis palustris TaxID=1898651 RepID=A0A2L2XLN9_9FIRM|nr:alpha-ribazole phosphatase [Desulfocucumis palustris]GBF35216.1 alpha-ribazole-5'-phosphate phosphatase [Desulfocucumis palustris]
MNRFIYLIRHGELQTGGGKRFVGQIDLPLADAGIKQAGSLALELSRVRLTEIFCSDLSRSMETGKIIGEKHKLIPRAVPELREISLGDWEGRAFDEIKRKYPREFKSRGKDIANYRPPGGESFADCSARAVEAFNKIAALYRGNILIVGHAGVNRLILCHLLGMPLENIFRIGQDYGCLNVIFQGEQGFQVKLMNRIFMGPG